jgi:hemoglobin
VPEDTDQFRIASRRAALAPGTPLGVTEEMIRTLVDAFYDKVRADPVLGPIFAEKIPGDWGPHLSKMYDFWSSVTLMTGRYHGTPMAAHTTLPIDGGHFQRWLALFRQTAAEVCPLPAAALFIDRAERIARSLQLGLDFHHGRLNVDHLAGRP